MDFFQMTLYSSYTNKEFSLCGLADLEEIYFILLWVNTNNVISDFLQFIYLLSITVKPQIQCWLCEIGQLHKNLKANNNLGFVNNYIV